MITKFKNSIITSILNYKKRRRFFKDLEEFNKLNRDSRFDYKNLIIRPYLDDNTTESDFDSHYLYHPAWAARKVREINPEVHFDFSSILSFSTVLSAFHNVRFFDYRPAKIKLSNFNSEKIDLTKIDLKNESVFSVSCMHTIEHIGLGRYGDEINPSADLIAMSELNRIIKIGGYLILVVPVGEPRLVFNAHRVYSFELIMDNFRNFELVEFSVVDDFGDFILNSDISIISKLKYGCGCFLLKKKNNETQF
jgi:hypothetical protein